MTKNDVTARGASIDETEAHPKIEVQMAPPIVEVADAPQGLTEIKVRDSKGVRIGLFQVSSPDMDDELADAIRAWQERHAHHGLFIMRASASAG